MKKSITQERIKRIFNEAMFMIENGKKPNLKELQLKHGYTEASAKSYAALQTKTWKELVNGIDDSKVLNRFMMIVEGGTDKDAISAGRELLKVKNRYPATKSTRLNIKSTIDDLRE
jgi:hypothetical protein